MKTRRSSAAVILLLSLLSLPLNALGPGGAEADREAAPEGEPPLHQTMKPENKTEMRNNMEEDQDHLLIVWTSGDPDVAHKMVFMYAYNAQKNGWWKQVSLLVWGPSQKLSSEDESIQEALKKMQEEGVEVLACKACADLYGVCEKLESEGITVKYTGTYLTDHIKSGKKIVTF